MISNKAKYALKALIVLAEEYEMHQPVLISRLAKKEHIPQKFLEFILLELKNKGILHSKKGKGGGYFLARHPDQVKLGEVMRILEGPLAPLPCLSKTAYRKCDECEDENTCAVRMIMKDVYESTLQILENTNLQDMIDRARGLAGTLTYMI